MNEEDLCKWSYSFEANGVRTKSPHRYDSELSAIAGMCDSAHAPGRSHFRLRCIWPRKKPTALISVVECWDDPHACHDIPGSANQWLNERVGKSIRITLEELPADHGV